MTYHKKGDFKRAQSTLEKALRFEEHFEEAEEARRLLANLKRQKQNTGVQ
jgi:hypothetical protein